MKVNLDKYDILCSRLYAGLSYACYASSATSPSTNGHVPISPDIPYLGAVFHTGNWTNTAGGSHYYRSGLQ
uniref:Uncharacterized protein OSJNBa0091F23.35 n=2 Tax=Oryza sativa subsp. japonica TaxID=39947 RepID=Q6YRL6_ORYSJ|nr:hypothetical protein [Oryza sativa Japonica Group]BAD10808.1 hypothetical protein [Oryza sativa Japonica Group]